MVKNEWSEQDLLVKAQNYCSLAEHCVSEVREKLYQWGAAPAVQDRLLDRLCQSGFIDEQRYVAAFVHDKVAFQGWGREKIRMMLLMKHLPSPIVEQAIAGIDEEEYLQQLRRLIEQKKQELSESSIVNLQSSIVNSQSSIFNLQSSIALQGVQSKICRFLAQRGFTTDEIWSHLQ